MRKITFYLFILSILSDLTFAQNVAWAKQLGGVRCSVGKKIGLDALGNVLVAGSAGGNYSVCGQTFSPGDFVSKYSPEGACIWNVPVAGALADMETDDQGNVYFCATYANSATIGSYVFHSRGLHDVYVAKLDPQGQVLWAKSGGGAANDESIALAVDSHHNVYLSGLYSDTAYFDALSVKAAPEYNAFFVRYSANGQATAVHDANTHEGWNYAWFKIFDLFADNDRIYWVTGHTGETTVDDTSFNSYYTDIIYTVFDTNAAVSHICQVEYDKGTSITHAFVNQQREVCWSGSTGSQYGGWQFVVRHDSLMRPSYKLNFCHPNWCTTTAMSGGCDQQGNLYSVCNFYDKDSYDVNNFDQWVPSQGQNDFFLIRADANAAYQGRKHWGGRGNDQVFAMAVAPNGDCYITGSFSDTLQLDGFALTSDDTAKFFLCRISAGDMNMLVSSSSIESTLKIFPNPTTGKLNIISGLTGQKEIRIFDSRGALIWQTKSDLPEIEADLSLKPKGIYFAEVSDGIKREVRKIILE